MPSIGHIDSATHMLPGQWSWENAALLAMRASAAMGKGAFGMGPVLVAVDVQMLLELKPADEQENHEKYTAEHRREQERHGDFRIESKTQMCGDVLKRGLPRKCYGTNMVAV
jgi:hypothetical protein